MRNTGDKKIEVDFSELSKAACDTIAQAFAIESDRLLHDADKKILSSKVPSTEEDIEAVLSEIQSIENQAFKFRGFASQIWMIAKTK